MYYAYRILSKSGVYLILANYSSPEFMKQWVLYIIFDRLAHCLLQLQTNTGFHTSTVETRRLFETSSFTRENTVLAVLLKFSHCEIYRMVPVRGHL